MDAGKLDRRITIERSSSTTNEFNEVIKTWSTLATVWASWRRASARETLASGEVGATATDVFEMRYSSTVADVSPLDRLVYQDRVYDISSVAEIGRREGLRIDGHVRVDGGE